MAINPDGITISSKMSWLGHLVWKGMNQNDSQVTHIRSKMTISRYLKKMGITKHRGACVPMMTKIHKCNRLKFAKENISRNWADVIFSDEKVFKVWNDGPVMVWRRKGDRYKQGFTRQCVKHSASIMMHLAIHASGKSCLTRCVKPQNSQAYQDIILRPNRKFIHRAAFFMHDGATCHTSQTTKRFLEDYNINVLPKWPANSPDMNPVEHCWSWISKQLLGMSFRTSDQLEATVRDAWNKKPRKFINNLYESMVRRLTSVQVANGAATRY
jgi:transposase